MKNKNELLADLRLKTAKGIVGLSQVMTLSGRGDEMLPGLISELENAGVSSWKEVSPELILELSKNPLSVINKHVCWDDDVLMNKYLDNLNAKNGSGFSIDILDGLVV